MSDEKHVPLTDATEDQLRAFAQSHLGVEFAHNAKPASMIARIRTMWDKDAIPVQEEAPPAPARVIHPEGGEVPAPAPAKTRRVRILIAQEEGPMGSDPVPVGVNGRLMLVPRGEEVSIPEPYFEVLRNAVTLRYDPQDGGGMKPPRQVPLYPMNVLGYEEAA